MSSTLNTSPPDDILGFSEWFRAYALRLAPYVTFPVVVPSTTYNPNPEFLSLSSIVFLSGYGILIPGFDDTLSPWITRNRIELARYFASYAINRFYSTNPPDPDIIDTIGLHPRSHTRTPPRVSDVFVRVRSGWEITNKNAPIRGVLRLGVFRTTEWDNRRVFRAPVGAEIHSHIGTPAPNDIMSWNGIPFIVRKRVFDYKYDRDLSGNRITFAARWIAENGRNGPFWTRSEHVLI